MEQIFSSDPSKQLNVFGSDPLKASKEFVAGLPNKPVVMYETIEDRVACKDPQFVDIYIFTPPCQSFSLSGKLAGLKDHKRQPAKLLSTAVQYVHKCKPTIVVMENVKNIMSKPFKPVVKGIEKSFQQAGYCTYTTVLNAKDFHCPQHRERFLCIL